MNDWPRMVYRYPGTVQLQDGGYDTETVANQAQADSLLALGWGLTPAEARKNADDKAAQAAAVKAQEAQAQSIEAARALLASIQPADPTRDELEQKATELSIKFDGRTSDKKLRDQIAAALE